MKVFKRKLWEGLSLGITSLFIIVSGGYSIAMSQSAAINNALNISSSEIERSDDEQYQYYKSSYGADEYEKLQQDYLDVGEQVESEGIVLLKNDGALPLGEGTKVSTFLTGSVLFNYATSGSSEADTSGYTDLKTALEGAELKVNSSLWNFYSDQVNLLGMGRYKEDTRYMVNEVPYGSISQEALSSLTEYGTAIVSIARNSGEGSDINSTRSDTTDGSYLSLSEEELGVLRELTAKKQEGAIEKIVVLLNSSATIQLDFLEAEDIDVDACLWVGNVGKSGINAVAKVLTGEYVPSGKLTDTYLVDNMSSPAMMQQSYNEYNNFMRQYSGAERLADSSQMYYGVYSEGIYVGYRYYETRYTDYVTGRPGTGDYDYSADVAYSFGYGLSYTTFEYGDFDVSYDAAAREYTVTLTVTNTGDTYSGKETVQVYLQKPYTQYDVDNGIEKAAVELVGYAKTDILAPGETSNEITITVSESQLKSYDADGKKTYIIDEGQYCFTIANGAHEAANNILASQGYTVENTNKKMDADGNASLVASFEKNFDAETYSVSEHTGAEITNQLEDADLNKYEGSSTKVTYVSRNNWEGTMPSAAIEVTLTDKLYADLQRNREIEEDEDAEIPAYGKNNGYTITELRGEDYGSEKWQDLLDQMTFEEQSYLITNGMYTTVPLSSVAKPDTHEYDGPTGVVGSQGDLSFPSEGIWAATFNDELIRQVGEMLAEDALSQGLTGLYANATNIHRTPFGGRSHEYYSEDPYLSAMASVAEITGIQSKGVIAHVKHIAFNDQEDQRAGGAVWLNEQSAREIYLMPFEYALSSKEGMGNAHAVMSAMNRVGATWVGASDELLNGIMRSEWGFDGYCITDMAASNTAYIMTYQDGIPGGTDLFLGSGSRTALDAYKSNATFAQAMREACHRILYVISNYSAAVYVECVGRRLESVKGYPHGQNEVKACKVCFNAEQFHKRAYAAYRKVKIFEYEQEPQTYCCRNGDRSLFPCGRSGVFCTNCAQIAYERSRQNERKQPYVIERIEEIRGCKQGYPPQFMRR